MRGKSRRATPPVDSADRMIGCGRPTELEGCTITFPRNGDLSVSVLGVEARLVGVQNGTAHVVVAGQQVTVPVAVTPDLRDPVPGPARR
jgi:hypothetical protein